MLFKIWSVVLLFKGLREYRKFNKIGKKSRNVIAFGVIGDGLSDDSVAIQRAINYIHSKPIIFPQGQYYITKTIKIG